MRIYGLTGGIGSGKSTVSRILRDLGAHVLDADEIYHGLIRPTDGRASDLGLAIEARFPGTLRADGSVDRKKLGELVFADPAARADLGALTHPAVAMEVARRCAELEDRGVTWVVYDVPLLYENHLEQALHGVVVVWVPRPTQLSRVIGRDGLTVAQAEVRLAAQLPLDDKRARASFVIDNSGTLENTRAQVVDLYKRLASA